MKNPNITADWATKRDTSPEGKGTTILLGLKPGSRARKKIESDLKSVGLKGNKKFPSAMDALSLAMDVLAEHNIELGIPKAESAAPRSGDIDFVVPLELYNPSSKNLPTPIEKMALKLKYRDHAPVTRLGQIRSRLERFVGRQSKGGPFTLTVSLV